MENSSQAGVEYWGVGDIQRAVLGATLLGGGAGDERWANNLVRSLPATYYPVLEPRADGRPVASWSRPGVDLIETPDVSFLDLTSAASGSAFATRVLPSDLSPDNLAIAFGIYAVGFESMDAITDECGYVGGAAALDWSSYQDQYPVTPAVLSACGGLAANTEINFRAGSAAAVDTLSKSAIEQYPQGFPNRIGVLKSFSALSRQTDPSHAGMVTLCATVGDYINQYEPTAHDLSAWINKHTAFSCVVSGNRKLAEVKRHSLKSNSGRMNLTPTTTSGSPATAYFNGPTMTYFVESVTYARAVPMILAWYDEDMRTPFTNARAEEHVGHRVSMLEITKPTVEPSSVSDGLKRSLATVGYGGKVAAV